MILISDQGQKVGFHDIKENYWKLKDVKVVRCAVPVGDYILMNDKIQDVIDRKKKRNIDVKKMDLLGTFKVSVDTKQNIEELHTDMVQQHERFRDELLLAFNNNIQLYILIENTNDIQAIEQLLFWNNPRKFIWMNKIRSIFTKLQKDWYSEENAIIFLEKKLCFMQNASSKEIKKEYFAELKNVRIDDILEYFKNKKVLTYLKANKIKIPQKPMENDALIKAMLSMQEKYGVKFLFCTPEESGKMVIELLMGNE